MDSSAIAVAVKKIQQEQTTEPFEVNGVTAVYDRVHPCQERYYAGLVGESLGLPVHFVPGVDYPMLQPGVVTTRPLELEKPGYWLAIKREIALHAPAVLTGAAADNLLECSPARSDLGEVSIGKILFELMRLRWRYGRMPSLGTGVLARLKGRKQRARNRLVSPLLYPGWINPEFARQMNLKERWRQWQEWQPANLHPRHPSAHNSLVGPDWNTDDICMLSDFTFAEERDPYLDLKLVEFVFSIPNLPWLFQKHLLRTAMNEDLPGEIIRRPKTPLGDLNHTLMKQPENSWVDNWKPAPLLSAYVNHKRIPPIRQDPWDAIAAYVNLRPLILNTWLDQIGRSSA